MKYKREIKTAAYVTILTVLALGYLFGYRDNAKRTGDIPKFRATTQVFAVKRQKNRTDSTPATLGYYIYTHNRTATLTNFVKRVHPSPIQNCIYDSDRDGPLSISNPIGHITQNSENGKLTFVIDHGNYAFADGSWGEYIIGARKYLLWNVYENGNYLAGQINTFNTFNQSIRTSSSRLVIWKKGDELAVYDHNIIGKMIGFQIIK